MEGSKDVTTAEFRLTFDGEEPDPEATEPIGNYLSDPSVAEGVSGLLNERAMARASAEFATFKQELALAEAMMHYTRWLHHGEQGDMDGALQAISRVRVWGHVRKKFTERLNGG